MDIPGLPTPPTDNFHKFKAIAGLWLVGGTLAGAAIGTFYVEREIFDAEIQAATLQVDAKSLEGKVNEDLGHLAAQERARVVRDRFATSLDKTFAATDDVVRDLAKKAMNERLTKRETADAERRVNLASSEFDQLQRMTSDLRDELSAVRKDIDEHRLAVATLEKDVARLKILAGRVKTLGWEFRILMSIGSVLSCCGIWIARSGFIHWSEIQSVQDELIWRQLSSPESISGHRGADVAPEV